MRFLPRRQKPKVECSDDGLGIFIDGKLSTTFTWRSVVRIEAFKADLFAVDLIYLEFWFDDSTSVRVHEEFEGFDLLVNLVERNFEGILKGWWRTVAFPAFEENRTVLWSRSPN